jgi:hypothetical protein
MKDRRKRPQFKLTPINAFDARRSYKRSSHPGVQVHVGGRRPNAYADFWRDKTKRLVVRFSSQGNVFHFEALFASGKQVPEETMGDFEPYVADVLADWLIEGADKLPYSIQED